MLRTKYKYDGVVCTDWLITADETAVDVFLTGKSWGVEKLSVAQRHYKILMNGVDQFGGNNESKPVTDAYQMGVKEHGEAFMRTRFEQSAVRLLKNIFRVGLFENPYLDPQVSQTAVGTAEFMKAGYQAQLESVVMLKNKAKALPLDQRERPFIFRSDLHRRVVIFWVCKFPKSWIIPSIWPIVKKYFTVTDNPDRGRLRAGVHSKS